jgi:hypothetical protein
MQIPGWSGLGKLKNGVDSEVSIMKELQIAREDYESISELIASDESPVGIDAKKTHVLILKKLIEIERRLERIESSVAP